MKLLKVFSSDSTYVSSCAKTTNFSNSKYLYSGTDYLTNTTFLSLMKFSELNSLGKILIEKATLFIYIPNKHVHNVNFNINDILLSKNTENFSGTTVTWANKPSSIGFITNPKKNQNGYIEIDITTLVDEWTDSDYFLNYGITIGTNVLNSCTNKLVTFNSGRNINPPYIQLQYLKDDVSKCKCKELKNLMIDEFQTIHDTANELHSSTIEISNVINGTYIIENLGITTLKAIVQLSPNGINFIDSITSVTLLSNESKYLTIPIFSKYSRLKFISNNSSIPSKINLWFQGQTIDYTIS